VAGQGRGRSGPEVASSPGAWLPLGRRGSRARLGGALVLAALLAAVVALEFASPCFADWTVGHPLTVTVLVGLAVVDLTVAGVEHAIATREGRRWRLPALLAIDAYIYSADRAAGRISARINETAEELVPSRHPGGPLRLTDVLELIVRGDSDRFDGLSALVREEADALFPLAVQAGSVAARSDRFALDARRIFDEQDRLGQLAETLNGLRFLGRPRNEAARTQVTRREEEAERILRSFLGELANLRIAVAEARATERA
jgi:hypothetical protein